MKKLSVVSAAVLMGAASLAFAAKPTSITFNSYDTTEEGEKFANYAIKCSNGKTVPVTAWNNRRNWCVGEASRENCHKKQIKAAKAACKI